MAPMPNVPLGSATTVSADKVNAGGGAMSSRHRRSLPSRRPPPIHSVHAVVVVVVEAHLLDRAPLRRDVLTRSFSRGFAAYRRPALGRAAHAPHRLRRHAVSLCRQRTLGPVPLPDCRRPTASIPSQLMRLTALPSSAEPSIRPFVCPQHRSPAARCRRHIRPARHSLLDGRRRPRPCSPRRPPPLPHAAGPPDFSIAATRGAAAKASSKGRLRQCSLPRRLAPLAASLARFT